MAVSHATWRDPEHGKVESQDLYEACRSGSNRALATLAHKVTQHFDWNDIVLPPDRVAQLREICNHIKYRSRVFHEWGFERKLVSSAVARARALEFRAD